MSEEPAIYLVPPARHMRWLQRMLVSNAPHTSWEWPVARRALSVISADMGDFLVLHIRDLLREPIQVYDDGNVRRIRVLGAIDYAFDRTKRIVWSSHIRADGGWTEASQDSDAWIAVDTFLCRPLWRSIVLDGVNVAARAWLQSMVDGILPPFDEARFDDLLRRTLARAWPRARPAKTMRLHMRTGTLRKKIRAALAFDTQILALARSCRLRPASGAVSQHWLTFVWRHAELLQRVETQTRPLLAPVAEYLFKHGDGAGHDPVRRFSAWLADEGIKPATFRLLAHRGPRPVRNVIRRWRFGEALDALVLALSMAQRPNGANPLPPTLCRATFDVFNERNGPAKMRESLRGLPIRFFDVARQAIESNSNADAVDQFLRNEYGLVLRWWLDRVEQSSADQPVKAGWTRWLALAKQEQARERANVSGKPWTSAIESWHAAGVRLTALISPLMLFDESTALRHCVARYTSECADGRARFFSARMHVRGREQRGTIGLRRYSQSWEAWDVRGTCNRPLHGAWKHLAAELAREYTLRATRQTTSEPDDGHPSSSAAASQPLRCLTAQLISAAQRGKPGVSP